MISLDKLKNIDTPARYIGGEARQCVKNSSAVSYRVCVSSPVMYEMGMFDFDIKDMYYTLNQDKDIWCERSFAPMPDFEQLLRTSNEKLYTLESKTPLKNMDAIVFVLSSELMYTNMINMLDLGGIPVLKNKRCEESPLIIATGCAALNPKPLEQFIDLFIIGEPAIVIKNIIKTIDKNLNKEEQLNMLKDIPGVYIPGITCDKVNMVKERHIDSVQVPKYMVIPSIPTMVNKSLVTLSKGCEKNCINCAHKYIYGKPEYMNIDKAVIKTKKTIDATGNTSVMLMTNCYATYPGFPEIIYKLNDLDRPKIKDLSFMEVKLTKENLWLLKYMEDKQDYPSIIVGAPNSKLRYKIGIDIEDNEVLEVAKKVFEAGFNKLRLKYIIGIPGETYEDFAQILNMAHKVCNIYKEVYSKSPDKYIVELTLYNFKAKPHTPSQWCAVNTAENLEIKQRYLTEKNTNDLVVITAEEGKQSTIETFLARGDKRVGNVIYEAWKQGARNDMINTLFNVDNWNLALNKTGVDIKDYLEQLDENIFLPWDNIVIGTPKEELRKIYLSRIKREEKH